MSAASPAETACVEGKRTSGSTTLRSWCGPASATVTLRGKTYAFRGGRCRTSFGVYSVNIGTKVLAGEARLRYFVLTVPAKRDGTYDTHVAWTNITFQLGGTVYNVRDEKITIAGNRTRGTFTATMGGARVTGSFTC